MQIVVTCVDAHRFSTIAKRNGVELRVPRGVCQVDAPCAGAVNPAVSNNRHDNRTPDCGSQHRGELSCKVFVVSFRR